MRHRFVRTLVGLGIMAVAATAMALRAPDSAHTERPAAHQVQPAHQAR